MKNKYDEIQDKKYFGFDVFDDIIQEISKLHADGDENRMYNVGLAASEGAVRRLKEIYYNKFNPNS